MQETWKSIVIGTCKGDSSSEEAADEEGDKTSGSDDGDGDVDSSSSIQLVTVKDIQGKLKPTVLD